MACQIVPCAGQRSTTERCMLCPKRGRTMKSWCGLLFLLAFSTNMLAQCSCVKCDSDYSTFNGKTASNACNVACICARSALAQEGEHAPGILTSQQGGKLFVAGVLPGSPAESAGVAVGDEIVAINSKIPGICTTWNDGTEGRANISLR